MRIAGIKINVPRGGSAYQIDLGSGLLSGAGAWARKRLGAGTSRIVLFSNPTVHQIYGDAVANLLRSADFEVSTFLMKDGERFKTLRTVDDALHNFSKARLSRTDAVVALGGGVVGDTAGFAASIHLRGVRFLQIPTTLLAMVDSSVGGKTGVNSTAGKNTIGAFYQPSGVLIDTEALATLPARHINAGFYEAVKHGLLSGVEVLETVAAALTKRNDRNIARMIRSSVSFKAGIVAADEREDAKNQTARSRKILNLGHTFAHALEKVTNYRKFLHGEAVGYGLLYAAELSKSLDLMSQKDVNSLYDVVQSVGALPSLANIDPREVLEAFKFDKKNQAGSLTMVLLRGIGKPVLVDAGQIPQSAHTAAFRRLLER